MAFYPLFSTLKIKHQHMKLSIKETQKTKVKIEIEQPWSEFSPFYEEAVTEIGKEIDLPGFRRGQAPRTMLEASINPEKLLVEAATLSINKLWPQAIKELEQQKMEVISQPQIDLLKLAKDNDLVFSAEFEVMPEVKLPDYKAIAKKIDKKEVKVEAKEVERTISDLQRSRATLADKPEAAQFEDFVEISFSSPEIEEGKARKDGFVLGKGHFPKEFEDSIAGMTAGQQKEVNFVSKDKEGKDQNLKVEVKMEAVKKVQLPEVNDEFAKSLGQFENAEALKKNIEDGMKEEKETAEKQRRREELLNQLAKEFEVDVPQILIDKEKAQMMENAKQQIETNFNMSFEDYLKQVNKTEEDLAKETEEIAKKRVKNFLALGKISKLESVEAEAEEVEEKINALMNYYPDANLARKKVDLERLSAYVEDEIKQEKTFILLGL
jgi:trigger factor